MTRRRPSRGATRRRFLSMAGAAALVSGTRPVRAAIPHKAVTVDLAHDQISLHWKDAKGTAYGGLRPLRSALEERGRDLVCLTNAGIYARNFTPLGLHVENGEVLRRLNRSNGGGNFFLKPNGVFAVTARGASVVDAVRFEMSGDIVHATQSGPLLFDERGFHPRFLRDSTSRYIRNGVGVRADGKVVLAITRETVTFWEFATLMRDELGCAAALYLDGNISRLWRPGEIMPPAWQPFVGMLAVTRKV